MTDAHQCPNCRSGTMAVFFSQDKVPVNSCLLLTNADEARAFPTGRIDLGFCPECGFISNLSFDPRLIEYSERYEETQGFSPTFNKFHKALAERLIERHNLRGKTIVEIGCGKGEFLNMVCRLGGNRGIGFDPGYIADREEADPAENVEFVADFYSEKYSDYKGDFVACKMTLEHIPETANFIEQVGNAIDNEKGTTVFFQVPESTRILKACAFEDIYYEHCSYFAKGSISRLFHGFGLEILNVNTEYDDQYLTIEAKATTSPGENPYADCDELSALNDYVASFNDRYRTKVDEWQRVLDDCADAGRKVVLWGSGSKGVAFLTALENPDVIEHVVDINPYRQGHHMVGFGQKIVGPSFLGDYRPDLVIVMNRIYKSEIREMLYDLSLSPEIRAL